MENLKSFLKFCFFTFLVIAIFTTAFSFIIYILNGVTFINAIIYASITGVLNGIFLGGSAILFLSIKSYLHIAKDWVARRK